MMMKEQYIFDFKLTTPIVVTCNKVDEQLESLAEKCKCDKKDLEAVLHGSRIIRFFVSEKSKKKLIQFNVCGKKVSESFNDYEILTTREAYAQKQGGNTAGLFLQGSNALKCLAILVRSNLDVLTSVKIPIDVYAVCNPRQWVDISELVVRVIRRNNRLAILQEGEAPDIILINEERILQEMVSDLENNKVLFRKDGTKIRSLNDVGYSLIYKWVVDSEIVDKFDDEDEFEVEGDN